MHISLIIYIDKEDQEFSVRQEKRQEKKRQENISPLAGAYAKVPP